MNDHDYAAQFYTVSDSKPDGAQVHDITLSLEKKPIVNFRLRNNIAKTADKGFDFQDLLDRKSVQLHIPPFDLGKNEQMTSAEIKLTLRIAAERIHVERAINKIKSFHIFDQVIPVSLFGTINQIWTVCWLLTLFQDPIISCPGV